MKKIDILESTTSKERLKWIIEDLSKGKKKLSTDLEVEIYNEDKLVDLIIEIVKKRKFFNLDLVVDKGETYLYTEKKQIDDLINIYLYLNNIKINRYKIVWEEINGNKNLKKWGESNEKLGFITPKGKTINLLPSSIPNITKEIILNTELNTVLYHNKSRYLKEKVKAKTKEKNEMKFWRGLKNGCKRIMPKLSRIKK